MIVDRKNLVKRTGGRFMGVLNSDQWGANGEKKEAES